MGLNYLSRMKYISHPQNTISRLKEWQTSFKRAKFMKDHARALKTPAPDTLDTVRAFFESEHLNHFLSRMETSLSPSSSETDINHLVTFLFCSLTYSNLQRPGAVINMTVPEATAAIPGEDGHFVYTSADHKTGNVYGPAHMVLNPQAAHLFSMYLKDVRPTIVSSSDKALVTYNGSPLTHYRDLIRSLCTKFHLQMLPNLTTMRKAGATAAVSDLPPSEMEVVSHHMSHSSSTSERFYRERNRTTEAQQAFKAISAVTSKVLMHLY